MYNNKLIAKGQGDDIPKTEEQPLINETSNQDNLNQQNPNAETNLDSAKAPEKKSPENKTDNELYCDETGLYLYEMFLLI